MNEERTIILNMLKEGKVSVTEAEALLNALGSETADAARKPKTEKEEIKIDLDGMKDGLKSGIKDFAKSMEGTIKSAMEGLKSLDLGNVVSSAFGSAKESVEKELILSADDVNSIELRTGSGDIAVTGGGSGDVLIQAIITVRGSDDEDAKERATQIEIVHSLEDGVLKIKDSGSGRQITGPYSVDYRITVPSEIDVNLQTMDGDVSTKSIDGNVKINNYSGDIHLKSCTGHIKANTKSGDIDVAECSGTLNVKSLSGDLTFSEVTTDELNCNTLSGDIEGTLRPNVGSNVNAKTLSGDIELKMPETSSFSISAETLSGSIDCELPVRDASRSGHRFTAILNESEGAMSLSTKSGDISLNPLSDESTSIAPEEDDSGE
jgi:DUF4097 and DUF4098 domain-containing protein YvlB